MVKGTFSYKMQKRVYLLCIGTYKQNYDDTSNKIRSLLIHKPYQTSSRATNKSLLKSKDFRKF